MKKKKKGDKDHSESNDEEARALGNLAEAFTNALEKEPVAADPFESYMHLLRVKIFVDFSTLHHRLFRGYHALLDELSKTNENEEKD